MNDNLVYESIYLTMIVNDKIVNVRTFFLYTFFYL